MQEIAEDLMIQKDFENATTIKKEVDISLKIASLSMRNKKTTPMPFSLTKI
jgi:hypothetical protein